MLGFNGAHQFLDGFDGSALSTHEPNAQRLQLIVRRHGFERLLGFTEKTIERIDKILEGHAWLSERLKTKQRTHSMK